MSVRGGDGDGDGDATAGDELSDGNDDAAGLDDNKEGVGVGKVHRDNNVNEGRARAK
jgi:hypothetical protein